MHDRFGVDVEDDDLLRRRSWRWLEARITALLNAPPMVAPDGTVLPATRLGWALRPPTNQS